ncbi:MAG TPA: hypothetical protein VGR21_07965, partial [Cryptosporangiaceae bacterium]|nr:hypothetical protein [Cryptosporangiaceae bacterium]
PWPDRPYPPASDVDPAVPAGEPGSGAGGHGDDAASGPHGTRPLPILPDGWRTAEDREAWSRPTTEIPRGPFR